jgi:hypothetical protein
VGANEVSTVGLAFVDVALGFLAEQAEIDLMLDQKGHAPAGGTAEPADLGDAVDLGHPVRLEAAEHARAHQRHQAGVENGLDVLLRHAAHFLGQGGITLRHRGDGLRAFDCFLIGNGHAGVAVGDAGSGDEGPACRVGYEHAAALLGCGAIRR